MAELPKYYYLKPRISWISGSELEVSINDCSDIEVVEVPKTGIGDLSDGFHTFNELYYQRMMLFAVLVKAYKSKAWKSLYHADGQKPFGGGWFIVGITTPEGDYTYHYKDEYWDLFDCEELPIGKPWDGHTAEDVPRLCSLGPKDVTSCGECNRWRPVRKRGNELKIGWCAFEQQFREESEYCSKGRPKEAENDADIPN